jgi:Zn/Cd-binding protein ZinT
MSSITNIKTSTFWCAASKVEKDQELNKYYRTGLSTSVDCEDNGAKNTMSFEKQNKFVFCTPQDKT